MLLKIPCDMSVGIFESSCFPFYGILLNNMMLGVWEHGKMRVRNFFLPPWNNLVSQWRIYILPEVGVRQNISLLSHRLLAKSEVG